jgi:hypothetical protein
MQLVEHDVSRAIRFFRLQFEADREEHGPRLARAFEQRYEFMQGPNTVEQYDTTNGILFRGGVFNGEIVERVQIYNNGILAEGKMDTSALDAFIDDVIQWVESEFSATATPNEGATEIAKAFYSQVVVEFVPKASAPTSTSPILQLIYDAMEAAGLQAPAGLFGFVIAPDPASGASWNFRLERRVGEPFASNKYFSSAPLTTEAHKSLLEEMERVTYDPTASAPPS